MISLKRRCVNVKLEARNQFKRTILDLKTSAINCIEPLDTGGGIYYLHHLHQHCRGIRMKGRFAGIRRDQGDVRHNWYR